MNKVWQAITHLLPTGYAWPRHMRSVLMRMTGALADFQGDFLDFARGTFRQWLPDQTCSRLEEWEEALGLPDLCVRPPLTDFAKRKSAVLARLRGMHTLKYPDSSADNLEALTAYLAEAGFDVEMWVNWPFRVGRNRVGDRLGVNGYLYVHPLRICVPARVGEARVWDRLVECTDEFEELYCLLKRIVPARFEIVLLPAKD